MLNSYASPALRRRAALGAWTLIALVPAVYVVSEFAVATRNVPFWDELDSAIDFIVRLNAGESWREFFRQLFALSNEHRTVTSRLIFGLSYWATGTVNFHVIGLLGNAFIVGACALLVSATDGLERRLRLTVVLALLIFQLEHYENFIWSGASIDHFQVVLLAVGAMIALTRDTSASFVGAMALATLATLTLAHGCVVWPVGIVWLVHRRAWSRVMAWSGFATIVVSCFFVGFEFNPGHHIPTLTPANIVAVLHFWIQLLGAPLVLGRKAIATAPGVLFLIGLATCFVRGGLTRHPVAMLTALFGTGSLVLVAFGRIHLVNETITSRYMILPALGWAMLLHVVIEDLTRPDRPFRWLTWFAPALIAINVAADVAFQQPKEAFIEARDRAATYFKQHQHGGEGRDRIYPNPQRADEVLGAADRRGVFHLPPVSERVEFHDAHPSTRMVADIDELITDSHAITVGGWGMLPGRVSRRGHVYLVLQSDDGLDVYTTLTLQRPDIAKYYHEPRWRLCGFRAVIGRQRLPMRNYRIGVLIVDRGQAEYLMTPKSLALLSHRDPHEQLAINR